MRPVWIIALATPGAMSPKAAASAAILTTRMHMMEAFPSVETAATVAGYQCPGAEELKRAPGSIAGFVR